VVGELAGEERLYLLRQRQRGWHRTARIPPSQAFHLPLQIFWCSSRFVRNGSKANKHCKRTRQWIVRTVHYEMAFLHQGRGGSHSDGVNGSLHKFGNVLNSNGVASLANLQKEISLPVNLLTALISINKERR
jgi:hypothetical protein